MIQIENEEFKESNSKFSSNDRLKAIKLYKPSYKRPHLAKLEESIQNSPGKYISSIGSTFSFFPYNSESTRDYGWGCAWRAIQSIVNTHFSSESECFISFEDLFNYFGSRDILLSLYRQKVPYSLDSAQHKALQISHFAPHELDSGWAEPFIGYLCLFFFQIPAELFLINGIPEYHNSPEAVFETTHGFSAFIEKLSSKMKLPVMIDDGIYAMTILDIAQIENMYCLTMGDPHIEEKAEGSPCFYKVYLDEEGSQIKNSVDVEQAKKMYSKGSYEGVHFKKKKWMVLFPL